MSGEAAGIVLLLFLASTLIGAGLSAWLVAFLGCYAFVLFAKDGSRRAAAFEEARGGRLPYDHPLSEGRVYGFYEHADLCLAAVLLTEGLALRWWWMWAAVVLLFAVAAASLMRAAAGFDAAAYEAAPAVA